MRILKNKIALANARAKLLHQVSSSETSPELKSTSMVLREKATRPVLEKKKNNQSERKEKELDDTRSTKNIAKNFGKAICNFSISAISLPYLTPILEKEHIEYSAYKIFIKRSKQNIDGLFSFRSVLLVEENDTEQIKAAKRVFKAIGEIFVKYFSVNWIYHGKVLHKKAHLTFRFKMLRRIQNPELFTYLQIDHGKQELKLNQNKTTRIH